MFTLIRRIESSARRGPTYERMDWAAYVIARTLVRSGPSRVSSLARALGLDGSTVTRQVAAMEARGQASRAADPDDARAWTIRLTTSGQREMEAIDQARFQRMAAFITGWNRDEVEQFATLLRRFNAATAAGTAESPAAPSTHVGRRPGD